MESGGRGDLRAGPVLAVVLVVLAVGLLAQVDGEGRAHHTLLALVGLRVRVRVRARARVRVGVGGGGGGGCG